ncbi:MAG: hypothetical protein ACMVO3_22120 [Thalassobaculum sp.]
MSAIARTDTLDPRPLVVDRRPLDPRRRCCSLSLIGSLLTLAASPAVAERIGARQLLFRDVGSS